MTEITALRFDAGLQKTLRLAVVADLHGGEFDELQKTLESLAPHALLCPGDTLHAATPDDNGLEFLREAATRFNVFCSIGNHEVKHGTDIRDEIKATGAILLDDAFTEFMGITIGGLSTGYKTDLIQSRLKMPPPPNTEVLKGFFEKEGFKLLLCHHPEYFDTYLKDKPVDLVVSGHAHGGQWRIFGKGIFAPGQGIFPKYTSGLYHGRLLVSRGLSNNTLVPRIFNKRQIVIIELK